MMGRSLLNLKKILLVSGDILFLYLSLWLTLIWKFNAPTGSYVWEKHLIPFSIIYFIWILTFYISGLYDLNLAKNNLIFYSNLSKTLLLCAFLGLTFFYLIPYFGITPKTILFLNLFLFFALFSLWRQIFNFFIKISTIYDNIIIVGETPQSQELKTKINSTPQLGYKIISIISPKKEELAELIKNYKNFTIISAIDLRDHTEFIKLLYKFLPSLNLENFSDFYEKMTGKIPLSQIDKLWLLKNIKEPSREAYEKIKKITDILIGGLLFLVFLAIIIPVAIAIKINSSGSVFYKQKRVGKNGKIFELIKFRSMIQNAEKEGAVWAKKNDERITKVGKILRKTLIDELPQSINILKGNISFLGPRPERPDFFEELEKEIPFYQIRHLIKPGLTGWAQVNYKYGNTINDTMEKLQYDLFYLKNRSFILDIKIFLKTINVFLKGGTL